MIPDLVEALGFFGEPIGRGFGGNQLTEMPFRCFVACFTMAG